MHQLGLIFVFAFVIQTVRCEISMKVKDECQKTKGCISKPAGCTPFVNCNYFMSYTMKSGSTDRVVIELLTTLNEQRTSNQWVGVGFSNDDKMGDDAVTYCMFSGDNRAPVVGLAYNRKEGKSNERITNAPTSLVTPIEGGVINSSFLCRFEQAVIPVGNDARIKPLNANYILLMASGLVSNNGELSMHTTTIADPKYPYISDKSDKVNVTDAEKYSVARGESEECVSAQVGYNLIKAHGILMIFGWWVFVATAILFARYFRTSWPGKKIMGTLIWFNCHRGLNTIGILMIASAFICIFIASCGQWIGDTWPKHAITGMTASICAFVQPIVAALRCHPGTAKRPFFNWIHRFIGLLGFCCACATIYFATYFDVGLSYDANGYAPRGMMIFYWVALVVVVIALELLITISERIQRKKITNEMHMQGLKGEPSMEGTGFISAPLWNTLRLVLLAIFVIIALAVAITLSCFIGMAGN